MSTRIGGISSASANAAHDDKVDAWSQAASRFRTSSCGIMEYYKEGVEALTSARSDE